MNFTNRRIEGLKRQYGDLVILRETKEDRLRQVRDGLYTLEEAELAGTGDGKVLAAARAEQAGLQRDVEAADRSLAKIQESLRLALADAVEHEVKRLPDLRAEAGKLRLAAAGLIGRGLAILRFCQHPQGVFGPDELVAVGLGPLTGRKSEPGYYVEMLAAAEAAAGPAATDLAEKFPELTKFKELTSKIRFLEAWEQPQVAAKDPAEWAAADKIAVVRGREQHLTVLVSQALAQRS